MNENNASLFQLMQHELTIGAWIAVVLLVLLGIALFVWRKNRSAQKTAVFATIYLLVFVATWLMAVSIPHSPVYKQNQIHAYGRPR
jgi:uncharacterized membrane protein